MKIKVLIVGVGQMGFAHALAIDRIDEFEIVGLVARNFTNWPHVTAYFPHIALYNDYAQALDFCKPDAVCISSYSDSHAEYACKAMILGADVFVEKPLATNMDHVNKILKTSEKTGRKFVVGLIMRHHRQWQIFIDHCKMLKTPVHFKITSHQYSIGDNWQNHKNILSGGLSPIIDVGIHYFDMMEQLGHNHIKEITAQGKISQPDVMIENNVTFDIHYNDDTMLHFESSFGPDVDMNITNIRKATNGDDFVEMTDDNVVIVKKDGKVKIFKCATDDYQQAILNQQIYFLNVIKDKISLDDHKTAVYSSHKIAFEAENQLPSKYNKLN